MCSSCQKWKFKVSCILTVAGVIIVVVSAYLILDSAAYIAEWIGIPMW
ncbi:MAG: hypothetical protein QXL74_04235 [Candidatus Bathyarchaeia archaeon]